MAKAANTKSSPEKISKAPTGITGLDEITGGGLPKGRPTLITGGPGCGKTLMGVEFLARGAQQYNEPGVFMAFEETEPELKKNAASIGFDLKGLIEKKKLAIDFVRIEKSEIEVTGEYDLDGLFLRLNYAIDSVKAKRVVLDTIESLFTELPNQLILRSELRRLFQWLKDKGVTTIITGERGDGALTRFGLEEYVSDAVIVLDHRVTDQVATRRLRIVKYRGSGHGTNEYPMLIDDTGFSVLPITSLSLEHPAGNERISSGVPQLDAMLGGKGFYRGSSVMVSGTSGTGKSSLCASFTNAACRRGERTLYFAFEESQNQIFRNMRSIGIDLEPWVKKGLLRFHSSRPTLYGLEMHLAMMHKLINEFNPKVVVIDPITNLVTVGTETEIKSMLVRMVDFLKTRQITVMFSSLTQGGKFLEQSEVGISSLMDSWLLLRDIEISGERNRGIYVLKSRGMAHSNQIREFLLTDNGIELADVYVGSGGTLLTGSARVMQESREKASALAMEQEENRLQNALQRKKEALDAKIRAMHAEFEAESQEALKEIKLSKARQAVIDDERKAMAQIRKVGGAQKNTKTKRGK